MVHEILCSRSFNKRDASATLVRPQIHVQDETATNKADNILVRRTIRKIFSKNGSLFVSSVSLLLGLWYCKATIVLIELRVPRNIVLLCVAVMTTT